MPTVSFNTHFPGYDVLGEISRSNARVLKARHLDTGDIVAIKHFSLNTDADTLRRFERESQIMTQINHPNIVRVREVQLDAELPYLVMDFVEGGSVRQLLTGQGSLSVEMTIRLGLQVLSAFRVIHTQGIVHRDVKPENILYHQLTSGELHFLLTDFGVARLHEQPVTVTGQSLMTYEYAAPEQFDNPRQVNEATDYYALGVVLYECLTGQVPFPMRGDTGMVAFMNAVMTQPPPAPMPPSGQPLPGSLERLLEQLLAKKADERLHQPDAVKLVLKQAEVEQLYQEAGSSPVPSAPSPTLLAHASGEPVAVPESVAYAPSSPSVRRSGRRPWLIIGLVAGALVLLGGTYWYLNHRSSTTGPAQPASGLTSAAHTTTTPATTEMDDRERRLLARQRYQAQVADALEKLQASVQGGRPGFFGGVKDLSVRVRNPSPIRFTSVSVKVQYVKENGDLFQEKIMYFNPVEPGATLTRRAPESKRGTRFSARVFRADAERPDSIRIPLPLNP